MGRCPFCGDLGWVPIGWQGEDVINGTTYPAFAAYEICECDAGDEHFARSAYFGHRLLLNQPPLESLRGVQDSLDVRWQIIHEGVHPAMTHARRDKPAAEGRAS